MKGMDPGYEPPDEQAVERIRSEADRHAAITGWKLVALPIKDITPRENIHWISETDFRDWKADLIETYRQAPETILPIVVAKRKGKYLILDGHHRWRAAKLAGLKALWVVQIKGQLSAPGFMEKQEQW